MVGFNDTHTDGHLNATHFIASRRFIIDHLGGCLAFEVYKYCANDAEATQRAIRAGRYAWAERSIVRHDHPTYGSRPHDNTDVVKGEKYASEDNALFDKRQAAGFPNDFPPAITE